jgi:hypothetical protein
MFIAADAASQGLVIGAASAIVAVAAPLITRRCEHELSVAPVGSTRSPYLGWMEA